MDRKSSSRQVRLSPPSHFKHEIIKAEPDRREGKSAASWRHGRRSALSVCLFVWVHFCRPEAILSVWLSVFSVRMVKWLSTRG